MESKNFINGKWVGIHRNPDTLVKRLRSMRLWVTINYTFLV